MLPNTKFKKQSLEFWAVIRLLNQRLGYAKPISKSNSSAFVIPTITQVKSVFKDDKLNHEKLIIGDNWTKLGSLIIEYMEYRKSCLINLVEPNLMKALEAKALFHGFKNGLNPKCPLPLNKQSEEKKDYSFLTGIVNMLIEQSIGDLPCDYDPRELTAFTKNDFPIRTLSRRMDGAFPSVINPVAIWEVKEYYYTTTFGSRISDGVYVTQLDGMEISEIAENLKIPIEHYLIIDAYSTWWTKGKSYLCRLIDAMHMGLVTEVIFGKEVITRIPEISKGWAANYNKKR